MENFISGILGLASNIDETMPFQTPFWSDPMVWIVISVVLIILTAILIYYKLLMGGKGI